MDGTRLSDGGATFVRPGTLDEALTQLSTGDWTVLSGGTDYFPGLRDRPPSGAVLDISALAELRGIREASDHWHIGALTTWSDVVAAQLPPAFEALKQAAREVGSVQIQNRGTVAGNLCNASPAADGVPPLLSLDARVELRSETAVRDVALDEFIEGNRQTVRRPDELVTAILVPGREGEQRSVFLKLGARRYLVISIVMVAGCLDLDADGRIAAARLAVGACSARARRLRTLEDALAGRDAAGDLADVLTADHLSVLAPIDDCRGTAEYRIDAAATLVRRALRHLGSGQA
jgi:CO/xanthine dehydrogenase FAD-binding subunit